MPELDLIACPLVLSKSPVRVWSACVRDPTRLNLCQSRGERLSCPAYRHVCCTCVSRWPNLSKRLSTQRRSRMHSCTVSSWPRSCPPVCRDAICPGRGHNRVLINRSAGQSRGRISSSYIYTGHRAGYAKARMRMRHKRTRTGRLVGPRNTEQSLKMEHPLSPRLCTADMCGTCSAEESGTVRSTVSSLCPLCIPVQDGTTLRHFLKDYKKYPFRTAFRETNIQCWGKPFT